MILYGREANGRLVAVGSGPVRSKRREILKPPYLAGIVLYEDDQVMTYHVWLV
jgi:hypothetical protein